MAITVFIWQHLKCLPWFLKQLWCWYICWSLAKNVYSKRIWPEKHFVLSFVGMDVEHNVPLHKLGPHINKVLWNRRNESKQVIFLHPHFDRLWHVSGSLSLASHCGDPCTIPGQSMWNMWWTNLHWGMVSSKYFSCPLSMSFLQCAIFIYSVLYNLTNWVSLNKTLPPLSLSLKHTHTHSDFSQQR